MPDVALSTLHELTRRALCRAGADGAMAESTARALVAADAQGLASHGVARVPAYVEYLRNGRADGSARPEIVTSRDGAVLVDAHDGLAFLACDLAVSEAVERAKRHGVALVAVANSHHFGVAAHHLEPVAQAGCIGIAMSNSPAAMPMVGGHRPVFGTNPIAAVFPRRDAAPIEIDLSLSAVARGKIMVAAQHGEAIPEGWALDCDGLPTTDARAALDGMMLPAGGAKGTMLALLVELLVVSLTGGQFAFEADSFFRSAGNRPRLGQAFLVVAPEAFAGTTVYYERIEALVAMLLADADVRLPGMRRQELARRAAIDGVDVTDALLTQLRSLADDAA